MKFIDQVENLRIVKGSEGQIYLRWENTEDGRDKEDMYERVVDHIFTRWINIHNKSQYNLTSDDSMFYILEDMYKLALGEINATNINKRRGYINIANTSELFNDSKTVEQC